MDQKLSKHLTDLQAINRQRRSWLVLSVFVMVAISFFVFGWDTVTSNHFIWIAISGGAVIGAVWWYWTMRTLNRLIIHRVEETEVLYELVDSIREIRKEVRETLLNTVDKDK
jgi:ABC-type bacteriocin/lantibiotic exporter with double-glycine peptidase domain